MTLDRHTFQWLAEPDAPAQTAVLAEAELLQRIRPGLGLAPQIWGRYEQLVRQRRAEQLTDYEYEELIALNDIVEHANVERIKLMIQLAKLRKTTLEQVMDNLGIRPRSSWRASLRLAAPQSNACR